MDGQRVNLADIVDHSAWGPLQWRAFILCVLCLALDGFDVQALGYAAPALIQDWGIPSSNRGPVFGALI